MPSHFEITVIAPCRQAGPRCVRGGEFLLRRGLSKKSLRVPPQAGEAISYFDTELVLQIASSLRFSQ